MEFGGKKLNYVISLGDQSGLNYAYDLRTGALFQVWRGGFLDATDMWHSRGMAQLAVPLGSIVPLSDAPSVAILPDQNGPWPDSVAFDDFPGGYPDAKQALLHPTKADLQQVKWRAGALYYARILPTPKGAWLAFGLQKGKPVAARRYVLGLYDAQGNAWAAAQGGR